MPTDSEELCRRIYAETRSFYDEMTPQLGQTAYGFRILYGPPIKNAPIMFVGYQPGGTAQSAQAGQDAGEHEGWPAECDYANATWLLARRLRQIWDADFLRRCTGINAIFVRSPSMRAWNALAEQPRLAIERFSRDRAHEIISALSPQRMIIVGLGTFSRLTQGPVELANDRSAVLVRSGTLWGVPAYGLVHLSGARVSRLDMERMKVFFQR